MVSSSRSMNPWLGASTRQGTSSERTHASVVAGALRRVWRNSATDRTSESAMGQTRIAIRASPPSLTRLVRSTAAGAGGRRELVGPSAQQDSLPARGPLDNCLRGIGLTRQAQRGAAVGFLALRRRRPAGELGAPDRRGRIHDVSSRSGTPEAHQLTDSVETVAVVVVTYNSERLIADLVASLGPGLRGLAWHLTVADNASSDNTLSQVSHHAPQARIVEMGRNAGYAAGINAAVAAAEPHTAVLVLNPDIRLTPGCVSELVAVLRRRRAGIVVPRLLGRGFDHAHRPRLLAGVRSLGRVVLPVLRGDRVRATGPRQRFRRRARAAGAGPPPGGRVDHVAAAVGAADGQQGTPVPPAAWPARRDGVLGGAAVTGAEPRRVGQPVQSGGGARPAHHGPVPRDAWPVDGPCHGIARRRAVGGAPAAGALSASS